MELRGKTVLLTGATGGLGGAIARALHREGCSLVLTGRNTEILDALATELGAVAAPADLTDRKQLLALCAAHGDVDILIANAGVSSTGALESYDANGLDRIIEANLTAPIQMTRALLPAMTARGSGHIVLVSSLSGRVASPLSAMYSATKFGLRGFGLGLRQDLADKGIGVSLVSPGFVRDAGMFADSGAEASLPPGVGTVTPEQVAHGTIQAITKNRSEVTVAPVPMRVGTMLGAMMPRVAARAQAASGGAELAAQMADARKPDRV